MNKDLDRTKKTEDNPPILGSWNKLYAMVILSLTTIILLFYFFTKAFE